MKNSKQTDFFELLSEPASHHQRFEHGGDKSIGKRKTRRPIQIHRPLHIVFKSSRARGRVSFRTPANFRLVEATLKTQAQRHGIRLCSFVIMPDHLHIKARTRRREGLQNFLRRVGSILAQKLTGARPGKPFGKFWDRLVYSRILSTRFEELTLARYFEANRIEARFGYEARHDFLFRTRGTLRRGKRVNWFALL